MSLRVLQRGKGDCGGGGDGGGGRRGARGQEMMGSCCKVAVLVWRAELVRKGAGEVYVCVCKGGQKN